MSNFTSEHPITNANIYYLSKTLQAAHADSVFLCILNGSLAIHIDNKKYVLYRKDIIYISSETAYQLVPTEPSLIMYVSFQPFFLMNTLGFDYYHIECNSAKFPENDNYKYLNTCLANLAIASIENSEKNNCYVYAKAYELLHYISGHFIMQSDMASTGVTKIDNKLYQLKKYIGSNYMNSISLSDAASTMDYAPPYLSNFIKKHLHMTFQEYLNQFRLEAALLLIKYTTETIAKISLICGFPNQHSFVSAFFKKYNLNPEEFRETHFNSDLFQVPLELIPVTNIALLKDYIFNYMNNIENTNSLYEAKHIQREQANILHRNPIIPYWNLIINIGTVADFDKPAFRNHLTMMQKELSFEYGRCYSIFSLVNVYQLGQEKAYDFSKIFDIIDFMKSIHLKPFFELSNKPFHIYKANELELSNYVMFLNPEQDDNFLFGILPHFIKACITRYGFDEFITWKFELWRRHNPSMSSLETPSDYCMRFQKTAHIMKTLVPNTTLGGPGFNPFLDVSDFEQLLAAFSDAEYIPDFISAYYFPFIRKKLDSDVTAEGYTTAQTPNMMLNKINELKTALSKYDFSDLPFYITEFSAYLSTGSYINDSTYPAVYILHQVLECYGKINALAYWVASDISLHYANPADPLIGGNGIISKDGIRKAGYYAYDFLNKLGTQVIEQGEHYIVTSAENNTIQILVYYHSNLNKSFANSPVNQELLLYPYSAFEDIPPLDFQLKLTHMTSGIYSIKETTLDLKHGNVLNIWGQLNHIKNIRPSDVEYMKNQSTPSLQIKVEHVSDTYTLHTVLNYNEAKLFTLALY